MKIGRQLKTQEQREFWHGVAQSAAEAAKWPAWLRGVDSEKKKMVAGDEQKDLNYRVIKKSEIPPPPPPHNKRYGQWLALARLIRMLEPDEAVEIALTPELYASKAITSIHGAARAIGVGISSLTTPTHLYIVRTGKKEPQPVWGVTRYNKACAHCGVEFDTARKWQEYCGKVECVKARKRKNHLKSRAA